MKKLILIASCAIAAGCVTREMTTVSSEDAFDEFVDNYYEDYLKLDPLEATMIGDNRYNDQLPLDISEQYRRELQAFYQRYQDSLRYFKPSELSLQQQVTHAILRRETALRQDLLKYQDHLMPIQQMWGLPLTMAMLGSGKSYQPFKTVKDYDDFLKRIDRFVIWMDTAIVNMRKGFALGYTYPRIVMEKVLPQAADMMQSDVTKSIFYQPIDSFPDSINQDERVRLKDEYEEAIKQKVVPAYTKLYHFLKEEYIPRARTSAGISALPDGEAYYRDLIRFWTTTELSPDSIFRLGESEVARIRQEMEQVKEQLGFKGDLASFFNYINDDERFMPFRTDEEVIEAFRAVEAKIQPRLELLFNKKPQTPFEIRQTEEFREMTASAEYSQGSPDGSRPGIFYVPVIDPATFNVSGIETLFLHEAIPGHHYQISLQAENKELPRFRRTLWYGAYGEGWALYAETLGPELGIYTDPIQYFGHLSDEMHRAVRLVVDVGLHTKGWSREQAIEYMRYNEPISEQGAVAEIERYMAIPAQALSYKIGQLKIRQLRSLAEEKLESRFNIALFHDEVLRYGNLPLDLLESKVRAWVAKR